MKRAVPTLLTALVLAIAVQALVGFAASWAESVRMMLRPSDQKREALELLKDGTLVVETRVLRDGSWLRTYRTVEGAPLERTAESMSMERDSYLIRPPSAREAALTLRWSQRIHGFWVDLAGPAGFGENWYAVSDPVGTTRFVGYDVQSKRIVGHLGRNGFVDGPPPPEDQYRLTPFFLSNSQAINMYYQAVEPSSNNTVTRTVLLPLPDEIIEIDFFKRTIASLWQGKGAVDVCRVYDPRVMEERKPGLAVRTPTHLHLLDHKGREKFSLEIPEALRDKMLFLQDVRADGATLLSASPQDAPIGYFAKLTAGKPAKVVEVPLDNPPPNEGPSWPVIGMVFPQPAVLTVGWLGVTYEKVDEGKAPSWNTALAGEWPLFWPTLLVVAILSALLAGAAWRRQTNYGLGQQAMWAGFVMLFGVPGWLGYRWHRAWPPREACPACGAMAPRDREKCIRCGAAFPPPARASFEIRD